MIFPWCKASQPLSGPANADRTGTIHWGRRPRMLTRRTFIRSTGATGLILGTSGLAAPALAQGAKIKIGYVSPQTGPLASFAESDAFNIQSFLGTEAGANFEVIVKDSQSNPNRAAEVASELILQYGVSMIVVASTPETTNPPPRPPPPPPSPVGKGGGPRGAGRGPRGRRCPPRERGGPLPFPNGVATG